VALFPKNIVFRNSGNTLGGLRSYFAAFTDQALKTGELFVKYDPNEAGYVSLLTQDPEFNEAVSVFGGLPQLADATYSSRNLQHLSTLVWKEDRLRVYENPEQPGDIVEELGDGWGISAPFPFRLFESSIDELEDVDSSSGIPRGKAYGDALTWRFIGDGPEGYFETGPGLGEPITGVEGTASLSDTLVVTYPDGAAGIADNSRLVWNQRNLQWEPKEVTPTLENRGDTDFSEGDPVDGDGLVYDELNETWSPGAVLEEGVIKISDGRRGVDKKKEIVVLTGKADGWKQDVLYSSGETEWISPSTEYHPFGSDWMLSLGVSIKTKDNSPGDYWERFPDGCFFLQQGQLRPNNFSNQYISKLRLDNRLNLEDTDYYAERGAIGYEHSIPPITSSGTRARQPMSWDGDYTVQFWLRFNDEINDVYTDNPNPTRSGQRWEIIDIDGQLACFLRWESTFTSGNLPVQNLKLIYGPSGIEETLVLNAQAATDYHVCFVYSAADARYKVWINGVCVAQRSIPIVGSSTFIDFRELEIGQTSTSSFSNGAVTCYFADLIISLVKEHDTLPTSILDGTREFAPPGPWARRLVEGPKAALQTLGITKTGLFSWIAKEQPYKWNTAFGSKQSYWVEQPLNMDQRSFVGNEVLSWDGSKFVTTKEAGGNDFRAKLSPGSPIADGKKYFSSIFNASSAFPTQDLLSGSINVSRWHTDGKGNLETFVDSGLTYGVSETYGYANTRFGTWENTPFGFPLPGMHGTPGIYATPIQRSDTLNVKGWIPPNTDIPISLAEDLVDQNGEGFHGCAIKFKVIKWQDLDNIIGGAFSSTREDIRISVDPTGRLEFRITQSAGIYAPNRTDDSGTEPYSLFQFYNGFYNYVEFDTRPNILNNGEINEIVICQDFLNAGLYVYVNGVNEFLYNVKSEGFQGLVPGDEPGLVTDDAIIGRWHPDRVGQSGRFYKNKGLPNYIAIDNGSGWYKEWAEENDRFGDRLYRFSAFAQGALLQNSSGSLEAFRSRTLEDPQWNGQAFYDFTAAGWYDAETSHPGQSTFTGTQRHFVGHPGFVQSSNELTNTGGAKTRIQGQLIGSGRVLFGMLANDGDRFNNESSFLRDRFGQNNWQFVDSYELGLNGSNDFYSSGRQVDQTLNYFQDVVTIGPAWREGETWIHNAGLFSAGIPDFGPITELAANEPITNLQDGDSLYWDVRLKGYVNRQEDESEYALDDLRDVTITNPSSNDQVFYNAITQEFVNQRYDYVSSLRGMNDVRLPPVSEAIEGSLIAWDAASSYYKEYLSVAALDIGDLIDVNWEATNARGGYKDSTYYIYWDAIAKQWSSIADERNGTQVVREWRGEWELTEMVDMYQDKQVGRALTSSAPADSRYQWYDPYRREYRTEPAAFNESVSGIVNTGRGDGGDFEYGDIDFGSPLGVFGGGNFETGEEDRPKEMIEGLNGGDFVFDNRRGMDLRPGPIQETDYTDLILYFDGENPEIDSSNRDSSNDMTVHGSAQIVQDNTTEGKPGYLEFPVFAFTEQYNAISVLDLPEIPKNYGPEGWFSYRIANNWEIQNDSWSIEMDIRLDQEDTHDWHWFTHGNRQMDVGFEFRNQATMTSRELGLYGVDAVDTMSFKWKPRDRTEIDYTIPLGEPGDARPWSFGEFKRMILCFDAETTRLSLYYDGLQVVTVLLNSLPGWLPDDGFIMDEWDRFDYFQRLLTLGSSPWFNRGANMQGAIDNVRLSRRVIPYDASFPTTPEVLAPYPLHPARAPFDVDGRPENDKPYVSACLEFKQDTFSGSRYLYPHRVGQDSTGFFWLPNKFALAADEVTDPYDESVAWPYQTRYNVGYKIQSQTEFYSAVRSINLTNGVSNYPQGWNGRQGLRRPVSPIFDLAATTFTVEAVIEVRHSHTASFKLSQYDDLIPPEFYYHSSYLLNCAAEEDLSDVTSGRSWAIRVFDYAPYDSKKFGRPWENGVKFEFWTLDDDDEVQYNSLDFMFGPQVWSSPRGERYEPPGNERVAWPAQPDGEFAHVVVQRDMRKGTVTVIINGQSMTKYHPEIKKPFRDLSQFTNHLVALGMDANMNFDTGNDMDGQVNYIRVISGKLLYGKSAEFPVLPATLSAT
jgi:hypothetical protein